MFLGIEPSEEPLPPKEWHKHLEGLLITGMVNPDILGYCDYKQQWCLNEIKKTFSRIKYRERNTVDYELNTNNEETNRDTKGAESSQKPI